MAVDKRLLAKLLRAATEAAEALREESLAAGPEEVEQQPTLLRHLRVAEILEDAIDQVKKGIA